MSLPIRRCYINAGGWSGYLCDGGLIERMDVYVAPSDKWRALCIRRTNNLGYEVERIRLTGNMCGAQKMPGIQWHHKNGKTRWALVDIDLGTMREYPIVRIDAI